MADNLHAVDVTGPDKVDEPKIITETEEVRDDSKPAEVEAKLNTDDKTTVPGVVDNQSVSGRNKSHSSQKTQKSRTHAPTRSSHSSTGSYITRSRASVSLSEKSLNLKAKKASLLAQAAILEEKEEIERQRLQLEQKAARLDMKTQIQMIEAEQQVLDSEHQEEDFENLASEHSLADERRKRTEDWVKKPLDPLAEAFEPTHLDDHDDNHNKVDEGLSQASHADRAVGQTNSGSALQGLVRVLQMPKVELGTFDGDPIRYWTFISSFENNVGCHDVEDHAKLAQLLQACKGKAHRLIEGCAAMPQGGYQRARRLLEERFGDRYSITAAWIDRATSGPRITADTLQDFADVLLSFQQTLSAIECLGEVNQRVLLQIAERLPAYIQHRWKREVIKLRENGRVPGVDNLVRFISGAAKEGTDPVFGQLGSTRPKPQGTSRDQKGFHGATAATLNSKKEVTGPTAERGDTASTHTKPQRCRACDGECTSLFRCEKFQQMSPEDRLSLAKKNGLCYCCLCHGHTAAECRSERTCRAEGCRYRHTKFLHVDKKANPQDGATCGYTNTSAPKVVLPVVEVKVTSQSGRNAYAYALLDSGSTHTFCAKGLLDELKSEGEPTRLNLSTLSCEGERIHTATHELKLADRRGCNEIVIHQVYACPKIPVSRHCGIQQGDLDAWEHLAGIEAPGLPEGVEIGILIGQDCPEVLMPLEVRTAADRQGAPFATRTLFGWTISGPVGVNSGAAATVSTAMTCGLEEQLEKSWELEGAKLNDTMKGLSVEDQRAMSNMRSSIQKDEGHYSIAVPFREDSSLPNNKELAAAAMSVQQDSMIRREMTIPIDDSTYWTDSAIVLAYIKNEKKRFHTYVANRLALIHAGSSVGQWKHVVTQENPADDLSRGLSLSSLASSRRWWHGPASLNRATDAGGDSCPEVDIEDDPEVKKSVVAYPTAVKEESSVVEKLIEKHSSWARLRRVIAWIRRFCSNLGSKARGQGRTEGQLKVRELEEADQMVVRHVQRHTYGEEIHALQDGASIKKKSAIYNLDPQLSEQGISGLRSPNQEDARKCWQGSTSHPTQE